MTCKDQRHDYEKFDDSRIFCRKCGDVRVVAPAPVYWRPYTVYPWPAYPTTLPWPYTITTSGTVTVTNNTAETYPYTLTSTTEGMD